MATHMQAKTHNADTVERSDQRNARPAWAYTPRPWSWCPQRLRAAAVREQGDDTAPATVAMRNRGGSGSNPGSLPIYGTL